MTQDLVKYWRGVADLADRHHAEAKTGSHDEAYWRGYAEAYREVIRKVEGLGDQELKRRLHITEIAEMATRKAGAIEVGEPWSLPQDDEIVVRID